MKIHELAWAAGLIDGEGYVGFHRQMHRSGNIGHNPCIAVSMTCSTTVKRLHSIFKVGNLTVMKPYKPHHQTQLRWGVVCRNALFVAESIHEYSVTKKPALQEILNYYARMDL